MNSPLIEICVDTLASAIAAEHAGANRIELCSALSLGGLTPGAGLMQQVREMVNLALHVMIRPREGDFCYSEEEFAVMKTEITVAKQLHADGVVFGLLLPDGNIDTERTKILTELAHPLNVTFHRAFDLTNDPFSALEEIISCGASRILTSGQAPTALEGAALIAKLVKQAGDRIIILPGSGINASNIIKIKNISGAGEFHLSGKKIFESKMQLRKEIFGFTSVSSVNFYENREACEEIIRETIQLLG
ncbi:MAG: copper homeostasis protein CutC [Lentimicrobiaceae bacterium]|jgi:copper homeostasis protein|nr:copper homeostasis protein CutC [Lentimicrobiaceae bacterium]